MDNEENKSMPKNPADKAFVVFSYAFSIFMALLGVLPFIMLISGSFTSEAYIINHGYSFFPGEFSLEAYKGIFRNSAKVIDAYEITVFTTAIGILVTLIFTSMTSYVIYRRDFPWRNKLAYFLFFTTLFSGGLTPYYMLMMKLGMKNNIAALIVPHMLSVFNILIVRNFMNGLPYEIVEAAKIDGANDFQIYTTIIMPLIKPVLATIALFVGLELWNQWYQCMLFVSDSKLFTLQYYLYNMLNNATAMKELMSGANVDTSSIDIPQESTKLAMTMIAAGPVLLLYPFVQKYFVKSITVGSVKG
ncbi:MAG: carbohydrate ABC transporter permease [Clostridia bacterium]|nr:carbohydrate ABC transporter permease [Clostridia bacterium]